tara:strand:- start:379 stop:633 length:255 start_codon:yes stop_codon:yes gene_type:complete
VLTVAGQRVIAGRLEMVRVSLRNPPRVLEFDGPVAVTTLLTKLDLRRDCVLVIRDGTLVPGDAMLEADAEVELRSVISGGADGR